MINPSKPMEFQNYLALKASKCIARKGSRKLFKVKGKDHSIWVSETGDGHAAFCVLCGSFTESFEGIPE